MTPDGIAPYYGSTASHFYPLFTTHTRVNGFVGLYEYQMDEKGRVSLPAAFRREAEGDRFILLQWERPYLTLFPEGKWAEVQERLMEYRKSDPRAWNQVRVLVSGAAEVSPDKQGRILLPVPLQQAAELSGTVLFSGNLDRVELWNPDRYREAVQTQADDLDPFAHRLFG